MAGIPVFVAILVGLLSSFVQSLGLTIQRKSHIIDSSLPPQSRKKPIRRPLWLIGFGIYITSNIFSTIFQLDSLPIVILAPLGAISLIYNAILARVMLGDKFGKIWILGTALIALGAVGIAIFGVVDEEHHTLNEILVLFRRTAFLVFFGIMSFAIVVVLIVSHITSYHVQRQLSRIQLPQESESSTPTSLVPSNYASPHSSSPAIPFRSTRPRRLSSSNNDPSYPSVPFPNGHQSNDTKPQSSIPRHQLHIDIPSSQIQMNIPNEKQQRKLLLCGLGFASASGTLSGMCLVLAKASVELLVISINHFRTGGKVGENEFLKKQTWFLVLGLAVCAVLQLVYLNYSLTFASPAIICPLAFCFFNLSSIFDGLVFYDQFSRLSNLQITFVSLGVAILLLGVWVVSAVQPDSGAGVDIGTWVEEESDTESLIDESEENLFPVHHQGQSHAEGTQEHTQMDPLASPTRDQFGRSKSYQQPTPHESPEDLQRSVFSNPEYPAGPSTPTSPMSPNTRRRQSYHHRMRYGSLIPDVLPTGAPTGFSIGLGASSPGFALRSGNFSIDGNFHPHHGGASSSTHSPLIGHIHGNGHRRNDSASSLWGHSHSHVHSRSGIRRSRSESQRGLMAIISGQDDPGYEARTEDDTNTNPNTNEENNVELEENRVEGELREWTERDSHGDTKRKAWWERLFGREISKKEGGVRLEGDERI